jgi:hypothetical protein
VNPALAVDPGLVYVTRLCTMGYTQREVFKVTHSAVNCSELLEGNQGFTLNYPSIAVAFKANGSDSSTVVLRRVVTNVGAPNTARVAAPAGVNVKVTPTTLTFGEFGEKKSFQVWVDASAAGKDCANGYGEKPHCCGVDYCYIRVYKLCKKPSEMEFLVPSFAKEIYCCRRPCCTEFIVQMMPNGSATVIPSGSQPVLRRYKIQNC